MRFVTPQEARTHYTYLLTLCIRKEEAFGPLALAFSKEQDLDKLGLLPEEQFNLYMAIAGAFAAEPKRYQQKLECLQKAQKLLPNTPYTHPEIAQLLAQDIQKTSAELTLYNEAIKVPRTVALDKQRIIVETDLPGYFLDVAQRRAGEYYQNKFKIPKEAKLAQHFGSTPKNFEPDNPTLHKEFEGACAPFMAARTNAFHMMLPFDLKISRKPDDPLDAGVRIFYAKPGYSFPLRYEMGKLCSYHDGKAQDIALDDPHLRFVSFSPVKERELALPPAAGPNDPPPEVALPLAFLEHTGSLGTYLQISCNFKVWFDSAAVSVLIQGAPDLNEYGLQGGAGLMTRTYASDKTQAYVENFSQPWQEGLSYNYVNLHLQLLPDTDTAFIPFNTPIFSIYPTLNRQCVKFESRASMDKT